MDGAFTLNAERDYNI
jgi:hypothetical protein